MSENSILWLILIVNIVNIVNDCEGLSEADQSRFGLFTAVVVWWVAGVFIF